ncbi:hypothetical protein [Terracidiphilus gabretensis]|uniref:hypothetical protein n=1 Tax=Terracidiphilus gabretensis TaxID=1577687 RepID=UPI00071B70F6|nr:hypothetical protein [Terracidiphilus gabretensis]
MRNITIQVTDDVYHHARVTAASRNMSVSALFRTLILTLEKQPDPSRPDNKKFMEMFPALPDSYLQERAEREADKYHCEHDYGMRENS